MRKDSLVLAILLVLLRALVLLALVCKNHLCEYWGLGVDPQVLYLALRRQLTLALAVRERQVL